MDRAFSMLGLGLLWTHMRHILQQLGLVERMPRRLNDMCSSAILPRSLSAFPMARRSRLVAEGGGLLNRYRGVNLYRGFESLLLRHFPFNSATVSRLSLVICPLVICPLSFDPCRLSLVIRPLSFVICLLSFVSCHLSLVICHYDDLALARDALFALRRMQD